MYRTITAKVLPWLLSRLKPKGRQWLWVLLTLAAGWLGWQWQQDTARSEARPQPAHSLLQRLRRVEQTRDSLARDNAVLVLSHAQAQALVPALEAELKQLRLKARRAAQYTEAGISLQQELRAVLRDSVIYDAVPVRVFRYADDHLTVSGIATDSVQALQLSYRDTLVQVVYRGARRRPWLWVLSRRELQQRVRLKSGRGTLDYAETIKIGKR